MNQPLQSKVYQASLLRRLAGLYFDFLVVSTALSPMLLMHIAEPSVQLSFKSIRYLLIITLVWFMRAYNKSFGKWVTSIDQSSNHVDPVVYNRETIITFILGFLMIGTGFEEAIGRIFLDKPISPILGWLPPAFLEKIWLLVCGAVYVWCGIEILKLRKRGYWVGIVITLMGSISAILSWHFLGSYMADQYQTKLGADKAHDKIAYMMTNYPFVLGSSALFIVALFILNRKRFR